ncbi:hypothetical protein SCATT_02850 [Streptantibioticus cattleyicolor NRRL 8057 = DSM 46488]|uniref:Uncharacterized protein n=1 Tax=Streptantibioticus cattleyicolor (strain ATCC 35852 / DSM 46488 / JCM 4925 / NBRC 14057 / NRRL 8057) TaxID=1003195 RepID=G8WMT6_STREN|nr:hypothetical protein SCATT_02850 [Streptantibioticus cattleyicolor NRRL 8057 = DSM 46488]
MERAAHPGAAGPFGASESPHRVPGPAVRDAAARDARHARPAGPDRPRAAGTAPRAVATW